MRNEGSEVIRTGPDPTSLARALETLEKNRSFFSEGARSRSCGTGPRYENDPFFALRSLDLAARVFFS